VIKKNGLSAYIFKNSEQYIAICWKDVRSQLKINASVQCYDIMGNRLKEVSISNSPIYLTSNKLEAIKELLEK
jgi:hypothetical protein